MGYLFVAMLSVILLGMFIAAMMGRGSRKIKDGTLPSDRPVSRDQPFADEPTPAASITAPRRQRENAREKTPPA
jgi:hypothetical protein